MFLILTNFIYFTHQHQDIFNDNFMAHKFVTEFYMKVNLTQKKIHPLCFQ